MEKKLGEGEVVPYLSLCTFFQNFTGAAGESQTRTNLLVKQLGTICRSVLTKFWIWIVAIILFTIGISGDRVTIFRIIYMALALIFIVTFQVVTKKKILA